jgi:hypothetical protein
MTASKDFMIFETEDYGVRLEYNKDFVIVHLPFTNKMNKRVFGDMTKKLESWYDFFTTVGYKSIHAAVKEEDLKTQRLVTMLKFKYLGQADGMLVYSYGE